MAKSRKRPAAVAKAKRVRRQQSSGAGYDLIEDLGRHRLMAAPWVAWREIKESPECDDLHLALIERVRYRRDDGTYNTLAQAAEESAVPVSAIVHGLEWAADQGLIRWDEEREMVALTPAGEAHAAEAAEVSDPGGGVRLSF